MSDVARPFHVDPQEGSRSLGRFQERLWAEELTMRGGDGARRVAGALSESRIDLNPHQIEAAAFALDSLSRGGCMLADEVGLGKTIEAGMMLGQLWAEGKNRILILAPATLRAQWQSELLEKFNLESMLVDGRTVKASGNPFDQIMPVICSHPFAANRADMVAQIRWDVVVIDEAHRLRNCHKPGNKTGQALKAALRDAPKVLLTATPLQNSLSELFGLLSLLDEQILGPEHAFRSRYQGDSDTGSLPTDSTTELKERISSVVQRTLRRQVREYVKYTNRRSIVEDFAPSAEEQDLYDKVSEYLRRSEAAGMEPGQKTLLTLVYRKLLASSTYAIAPTLRRLAESLERRLHAAKLSESANGILFRPDEVKQYSEEEEEWSSEPATPANLSALQNEMWELRQYADLADSIRVNAKGEALKRALDRIFTVARAHQWPEKAVIFTESRRTQEYLCRLLSDHGFKGRISMLSGDAGKPEERRALVDEFRERTQILLSTEAGAEGLNLQFCNLIVNYDLPWNPQRVEQRIGRCHRYGQLRDVLVLNFLNRQNAADARLYELLEKKLNLFDGVFGASDEILGALESGVDFERRVLNIYQSCRHPDEINKAFDALRSDLESRINQRMTEARSLLLERFDGEIRRRMKIAGDKAKEQVARRQRGAKAISGNRQLKQAELLQAARDIRNRPAEAVSYLRLDASYLPSRMSKLAGKEGWWFVYRFETTGLKAEERLVHLVLLNENGTFRALPLDESEHFAKLNIEEETRRKPPSVSVTLAHETAVVAAKEELLRLAERREALELDAARERADRYAEDCLIEVRNNVVKARQEWELARKELLAVEVASDRPKARAHAEKMEREYRKRLAGCRSAEDQRYAEKDRNLGQLVNKAKVNIQRTLVASAYFWLA